MSRTPNAIAQDTPIDFDHALLAQDVQAAKALLAIKADYAEGRDLANQLLGQVQMSRSFAKFADVVGLSKLKYIKENKIYRAVAGQKAIDANGNEIADVGTWDGFCAALGTSRTKVDEDLLNLKAFGEEALEQMQRTGIGYRELRQYRKLPEDQKLALIEVAKAGDKEGFVELAEEIIAKHAKEKEAAAATLAESEEKLAAKDRALAASSATIANLHEQLGGTYEPRPGSVARTQQEEDLLEDITSITLQTGELMRRLFLAADTAFEAPVGEGVKDVARQSVEFLCQELAGVAVEFGIKVDFENLINPPWMTEAMQHAIQAKVDQAQAKDAAKALAKASGKTKLSAVSPSPIQ